MYVLEVKKNLFWLLNMSKLKDNNAIMFKKMLPFLERVVWLSWAIFKYGPHT